MRRRFARAVVLGALLWVPPAWGAAVSGPHETVDQQFTATRPGAPSGSSFSGSYHAAGDPNGPPPYLRRMVFSPPPGLRYDTSVPARCTAGDLELETQGPTACPAASKLGQGSSDTAFLGQFPSTVDMYLFNNTDEQIILAASPFQWTVARGHIGPDGTIEFASPTCYPSAAGCPIDDALQLRSSMTMPAYTTAAGSYLTTPPTCPSSGHWDSPIQWWWADGTTDTVITHQPCRGRRPAAR